MAKKIKKTQSSAMSLLAPRSRPHRGGGRRAGVHRALAQRERSAAAGTERLRGLPLSFPRPSRAHAWRRSPLRAFSVQQRSTDLRIPSRSHHGDTRSTRSRFRSTSKCTCSSTATSCCNTIACCVRTSCNSLLRLPTNSMSDSSRQGPYNPHRTRFTRRRKAGLR